MGMFDEIRCLYPLPLAGANERKYQTKSMRCAMDEYEIREDGTLWLEVYETEDRSDPNAKGLMRCVGMLTRVNKRWVQESDFTGAIEFCTGDSMEWLEWSAYFVNGVVAQLHLIENRVGPRANA